MPTTVSNHFSNETLDVSSNLDNEVLASSDVQVAATSSSSNGFALCVLYIFAGAQRKSDLRESLEALQKPFNFLLYMREVDLIRGEHHDVCNDSFWNELMDTIEQGKWDIVLCTPPCHTHSRSRNSYRSSPGPRPVRSLEYPYGFPWLTGKNLAACTLANTLIDKTVQSLSMAFRAGSFFLCEHPEDLGVAANSENPASIWQLDVFHELLAESSASTWALFQCVFNANTSKPTRMFSNLLKAKDQPFQGWPYFDAQRLIWDLFLTNAHMVGTAKNWWAEITLALSKQQHPPLTPLKCVNGWLS